MFGDKPPQVLISGAGPVGLFTALCLARRGVAVRVVDTGVWACSHSYALGLHPQTLPLFAEVGLLERVLHSCYPVNSVALAGADGVHERVALSDYPATECLAVLRQDVLEGLLERALQEQGVQVDWRHEVAEIEPGRDGARAKINRFEKESRGYIIAHTEWVVASSSTVDVPYVIGADGHNSRVRHALGYQFPEVGPAQYFAVFELSASADLRNEMTITLGDGTADVLWPLPGGECRWSFLLPDYKDQEAEGIHDALLHSGFGDFPVERTKDRVFRSEGRGNDLLSEGNLHRLLAQRAPWFQYTLTGIRWRTVVRFERRLAPAFGEGRLWLAGDAAHLTGPVGIQSMNVGLAEGYDLAKALAGVIRDGASPDTLDAYSQHWSAQWRDLHGQTMSLEPLPGADPLVAAHAGELLSMLPAHGERLEALAGKFRLKAVERA